MNIPVVEDITDYKTSELMELDMEFLERRGERIIAVIGYVKRS